LRPALRRIGRRTQATAASTKDHTGRWREGAFHPLQDLSNCAQKWESGEITQLEEHVEWSTNADAPPSSVIAMLTIANYTLERALFLRFRAPSLHRVQLRHRLSTRHHGRRRRPLRSHLEPEQRGLLTVTCNKRLHFNAARSYDLDLAAMLNMFFARAG